MKPESKPQGSEQPNSHESCLICANCGKSLGNEELCCSNCGQFVNLFPTPNPPPNPSADEEVESGPPVNYLVQLETGETDKQLLERLSREAWDREMALRNEIEQLRQQNNAERATIESTATSLGFVYVPDKGSDHGWSKDGQWHFPNELLAAVLQQLRASLAEKDQQQFTPSKLNTKYLQQIESLRSELVTAQAQLQTALEERDQWGKELGEAKGAIDTLERLLKAAEEERDAARASAISWESTARSLSDATLPCGHPEACAIDISPEGKPKWSSIGCVWCQRDAANIRLEEAEKVLSAKILGHDPEPYLYIQFPATVGHIPLMDWFASLRTLLSRLSTSRETENKT